MNLCQSLIREVQRFLQHLCQGAIKVEENIESILALFFLHYTLNGNDSDPC